MAFDGVLPPEFASFAGAGCDFQISGIPEHPGTPPGPNPLSGTAGPAACGETGRVGSLSGPVVAIRCGPTVPIGPQRAREICFFLGGIMGGRTPAGNPQVLYKQCTTSTTDKFRRDRCGESDPSEEKVNREL